MFLKHGITVALKTCQHLSRRPFVKRHRLFQLRGTNHRVDLRRIDALVSEQRAHLLEFVSLLQHFHRDAMTDVVRLQHRIADQLFVELAQPPDVFPGHRRTMLPDRLASPHRPEERCLHVREKDGVVTLVPEVPLKSLKGPLKGLFKTAIREKKDSADNGRAAVR
jgi:hypothetical protein